MAKVAFLGLGEMGMRMATNLLKAGHRVIVYNRTPERALPLVQVGAVQAGSPLEAAKQGEIVISMLTDVEASRSVWLDESTGAIHALREGIIAIESSTVTPEWARELGEHVTGRGAGFLDAPVSGSLPQAESGELIFLIGGSKDIVDKAVLTLKAMGSGTHHIGPVGSGAGMKLAVNTLLGIEAAALGEVLNLIRKLDLDESKALAMLNTSPLMSPRMKHMIGQMSTGTFAPNFPIDLVAKDFGYIVDAAASSGASVPLSTVVCDLYNQAQGNGLGEQDIAGIAQIFE